MTDVVGALSCLPLAVLRDEVGARLESCDARHAAAACRVMRALFDVEARLDAYAHALAQQVADKLVAQWSRTANEFSGSMRVDSEWGSHFSFSLYLTSTATGECAIVVSFYNGIDADDPNGDPIERAARAALYRMSDAAGLEEVPEPLTLTSIGDCPYISRLEPCWVHVRRLDASNVTTILRHYHKGVRKRLISNEWRTLFITLVLHGDKQHRLAAMLVALMSTNVSLADLRRTLDAP